ncbi:MAG TPA: ATP-binding cassette domain-containing protein, partial [Chloroflexota bacterium]
MLHIEHLVKDYPGSVRALDDVCLDVHDGEFVVLIGLSGSGKSTLLRCINRLIEPTSGRIMLDGQDVTAAQGADLRKIRRGVGMIFQQFNLVKRSTVLTNVLTGRLGYVSQWQALAAHFGEQDYRRALANLERVGLRDRAQQRAD